MNEQVTETNFVDPQAGSEIGEALTPPNRARRTNNPSTPPGFVLTLGADVLDRLAPDGPIFGGSNTVFSMDTFVTNIRDALDGNCVGYGFAINNAGALARSGGGGSRQLKNNPANNLAMSARRRMHTASVTKNITATAVVKAMLDRDIEPAALIRDFLPTQWTIHGTVDHLQIRDLLTHKSGFNTFASDPHYSTLRALMENPPDLANPIPDNAYDNRNFGLFRLILPYMVCPQVMANAEAEGWAAQDYDGAVDQATQEYYKLLVRHYVFNPMGMRNMNCAPNPNNSKRTMCYMWPNPSPAQAQDGGDRSDEAGGEGWVMSARQLAKYLRFRRYNTDFLPADAREMMDENYFGWRKIQGDQGAYLEHGGAYGGWDADQGKCVPGSGPVSTQIMQFPIHIEAAIMVNSFVSGCNTGPGLNRILADAFDASFI